MPKSEFASAISQICDEKGLKEEQVIETIEAAIASAYRKDYGKPTQKIKASFDTETGETKIWQVFEVVEEVTDPEREISLKDAKKKKKKAKIGDEIEKKLKPASGYGRIAAQTAKQVVIQRIREAERNVIYDEFSGRVGELISGVVQQIEGRNVIVNLGKANGIIFPQDQIPNEKYYIGQRLKLYLVNVEKTSRGPVICVSRTHPELIRRLFELEVPEINAGSVEVKSIAREPGRRTKIAVTATQQGVDPVGSCVGQRGTRVQAVIAELPEEKIDIILWNEGQEEYIKSALSPAKVDEVKLKKKEKIAQVKVNPDQLSLAIGRQGQNVRLASKLTGWEINVEKEIEAKKETLEISGKIKEDEGKLEEKKAKLVKKKITKKVKKAKVKKTKVETAEEKLEDVSAKEESTAKQEALAEEKAKTE